MPTGETDLRASVVICTYDRPALLRQTVDSALGQTLPRDRYEILVVDNSPDQAAAARNAETYCGQPRLSYVLEPRAGASNARNVGARMARGRYLAFIDDDIVAGPAWLAAMLDAFAAHPEAGIVGGRVLPRWTGPRPPWLHDGLLTYLSVIDWGSERRAKRRGEWLGSGNMALPREDFLALGGFHAGLGRAGLGAALLSNEDVDLVRRVEGRGRAAIYAPDAVVEHVIDPARLTQSWLRRRAAWQAVSDFLMDPAAAPKLAADAAARMRIVALARRDTAPGLFANTDDPAKFLEQMQVAYHLTMAMLGGGVEVDAAWPERANGPASSEARKTKGG